MAADPCPYCAEADRAADSVCRVCGRDLAVVLPAALKTRGTGPHQQLAILCLGVGLASLLIFWKIYGLASWLGGGAWATERTGGGLIAIIVALVWVGRGFARFRENHPTHAFFPIASSFAVRSVAVVAFLVAAVLVALGGFEAGRTAAKARASAQLFHGQLQKLKQLTSRLATTKDPIIVARSQERATLAEYHSLYREIRPHVVAWREQLSRVQGAVRDLRGTAAPAADAPHVRRQLAMLEELYVLDDQQLRLVERQLSEVDELDRLPRSRQVSTFNEKVVPLFEEEVEIESKKEDLVAQLTALDGDAQSAGRR